MSEWVCAHTYSSQSHTRTHTHRQIAHPFLSVLLPVPYPAQCSEGALSLIAFPSPLIILMVFHATRWASACLLHIKITHSLQGGKWKPYNTFTSFLSGALCACHAWSKVAKIEHCHCLHQNDYNPIIIASSNPTRLSSVISNNLILWINEWTNFFYTSDWVMRFWYSDTGFIKLGSVLSRFDCI